MGGNFYSGVEPAKLAQAGVDTLVSPQLENCIDEWIPLRGRVCSCILRLLGISLCLIQAYGPNSSVLYLGFMEETSDVCGGLKRTNPRYFWETSLLTLGMMPVYGSM